MKSREVKVIKGKRWAKGGIILLTLMLVASLAFGACSKVGYRSYSFHSDWWFGDFVGAGCRLCLVSICW